MKTNRMIFCATLLAIMACGATNALAHDDATTTTTVTGVRGTISSLNYDENGTIDGFLLGTNILLSFSKDVCGGIGSLGVVGNTVTYSGRATTNATTGFQTVRVTSFTNGSITYTSTTSHPTPAPYGPTAGTVGQLNYDSDGNIDGFLFGGVLVVTGEPSATLKPLLFVGAAVSVTGTSETSSACVTVPPVTVVEASSLTFGSTTIVIHEHH